jgi:hypothetical protein
MGRPQRVLVMPEGYLYEAIRDWYENDPYKRWTKKGKAEAISRRGESMGTMKFLLNRNYSPMFDKYHWQIGVRGHNSHHARYYIEFFLSEEYLND